MKTYTIIIDSRDGDDNGFLGPFSTFETAQEALVEEYGDWIKDYTEYDSSFEKGQIYTEEFTAEIIEREMK